MTHPAIYIHLTDHGLIRASGEDAGSFLHNLLTNDIKHLEPGQLRHAALCTPKGRIIATFLVWQEKNTDGGSDHPDYFLMLSADILPGILKTLSMYVLRSKVTLRDISAERTLIGVIGSAHAVGAPVLPEAPMSATVFEEGAALRLDVERSVLAIRASAAARIACHGDLADWHRAEIRHGIPRVQAATKEMFTPQMLNYDLAAVGGVSFQKGCYPGQEVVARTHYLGRVKRRMYRVKLDAEFPPGTEVFTPEAAEQHCGAVVLVAPAPTGGFESLVVVQSSGAEGDTIRVGSPSGAHARLLPLPYAVE